MAQQLGQKMGGRGFSNTGVTLSSVVRLPDLAEDDCGSVYGDSAQLIDSSEILAAFGGGAVGMPPYVQWKGLMPCEDVAAENQAGCPVVRGSPGWLACVTAGMITLAHAQPATTVIDNHAKVCVAGYDPVAKKWYCKNDNATNTARNLFSDLWSFLQARGLSSGLAMMGETESNEPCEGSNTILTQQNVDGYKLSTLFTSDAANTVLRPWENSRDGTCYVTPAPIGTGYGPYAP